MLSFAPAPSASIAHRDEVHRRRAHEVRHEQVGGVVVDLGRGAELLEHAVLQHRNPAREGHRLDLVVGHVDDGRPQGLVEPLDLGAHLDAKLGVEVRERLVEEKELRIAHERSPHRHPLALAAGELGGASREQGLDSQGLRHLGHRPAPLGLRHAAHLHAEAHVLLDAHRGVERVGLEHHGDVAPRRREVVDGAPVDADLAPGDRLEPRDGVKEGGLAAARRPHQDEESALLDREVDVLEDLDRPVVLVEVVDFEEGHGVHPFTAPAISPRTK